jgi:hypothetical protein
VVGNWGRTFKNPLGILGQICCVLRKKYRVQSDWDRAHTEPGWGQYRTGWQGAVEELEGVFETELRAGDELTRSGNNLILGTN